MKGFFFLPCLLIFGPKGSWAQDCDESGTLLLEDDAKELTACLGSVIRFKIIPDEVDSLPRVSSTYDFKIEEGPPVMSILIQVKDEEFSPSDKDILLISHHHHVKISKTGDVPFTLAYKFVPPKKSQDTEIKFGDGEFKNMYLPSHFYERSISLVNFVNDRQEVRLEIPAYIWSDQPILHKNLYDPEYILATIDTNNGRIGMLTSNSVHLGLRKLSKSTTLRLITGTRSRQTLNDELKISGSYDLGDKRNLSTISPLSTTAYPPYDPSSIQIFIMSINENEFYDKKFSAFKEKLSNLLKEFSTWQSAYNTNCELTYNPPEGFRQCREDCSLSEYSSSRGCGSISVNLKKNIAECAVYTTEHFRNSLEGVVSKLSEEFEADITLNDCLSGAKTGIIITALPVVTVVCVFIALYTIGQTKSIWSRCWMKKSNVPSSNFWEMEDEKDLGKDNDMFFEDWNKEAEEIEAVRRASFTETTITTTQL